MRRKVKRYKVNYSKLILSVIFIIALLTTTVYGYKYFSSKENKKVTPYNETSKENDKEELKPKEAEEYTLKISAGGDLLIHDTVFKSVKSNDGTYNFDPVFEKIKYVFEESDLSMINLEVPVAGNMFPPSNYPNFNSPVELLDGVKNMGVEVVSTANNHALDKGLKGLQETIKNAESKELKVVGTYLTDDTKPLIIEKNNIKVGIASYTYGTNGIPIPKSAPYCVNIIDKDAMLEDINYMKEQKTDFIIFSMHFGQEYQTTQNKTQEELVDFLVNNGVDIVFGSHPHVPQPYEIKEVELENGLKKQAYVVYSLGNFVSNQVDYYTKLGGIATVTVSKKGDEKKIADNKVTPIYTELKRVNGKSRFRVLPLEKEIYEYEKGITTYSTAEYNSMKKMLGDTNYIYNKLQK
ncbi:MAG: CapA family protein [Clostridia bacterium]|nr:CapA family protein [Clostridia bacterium]MDD4375726.1 CapA family protein [Clostridia bacterium]